MPAGMIKLISFTNIDVTTSLGMPGGGGHGAATFWINLTGITRTTGTLNVEVRYGATSVLSIAVAAVTGLSATGLARLVLTADFDATIPQAAIPEPNFVTLTLVGDTADVAGEIWALYGD